MSDAERLDYIGGLACELLEALQPWEMQGAVIRSAAARLTVALAAVPLSVAASPLPPGKDAA